MRGWVGSITGRDVKGHFADTDRETSADFHLENERRLSRFQRDFIERRVLREDSGRAAFVDAHAASTHAEAQPSRPPVVRHAVRGDWMGRRYRGRLFACPSNAEPHAIQQVSVQLFTSPGSRWWHRGMAGPQMIVDHARAGDLDQLKAALANGCSPNEKCPRNASTPLIAAAGKGHLSIVEHVLGIGAELDHENDDGASAADAALAMGHEDIVTTLAKHELIGSTRLRFAVEQDDHKGLPQLLGRWALAHRMRIGMSIAMHCVLHANCPCIARVLRVHCTHIATRVLQHIHAARMLNTNTRH